MKEELNYLSERIEKVDHEIGICAYGIKLGLSTMEEKTQFQNEKIMLENILNKLTEIELS